MDVLKPSTISQRIAEAITARLASPVVPGAWRQSRYPYGAFGPESPEIEHHGFAIGLPRTTPLDGDRRDRLVGAGSFTEVAIRWAHHLRAEGAVVDERAALDAELELVAAVGLTDGNPELCPIWTGTTRSTSRNGLVFVGECRFDVGHYYPLG